ncbi:NADP-dependent oxidoreductase domain-containing protein [Roridomyces roridus]|uniref:NADP-dependent oxidoreductase domain-containing protein n=1 Tax=Roridomyces roridus TaxID=1738132 RepID=A0AAD7BET4_9AGAR|nr:NADP-dependent oxidoreductase domain-containing protein [Roridomyces roridus]
MATPKSKSNNYPTRTLGPNGPVVSALGLGAGGLSGSFYGKAAHEQVFEMLTYAADRGVTFWDTSDFYGESESVIGDWFAKTGRRSDIFLATKFGIVQGTGYLTGRRFCSQPEYIKEAVQNSLKKLQTEYIDLYYQHRVDPSVPIEIVLETLRPFVDSGVIKWLGLSECSAATLRRAKAVAGVRDKIVAVQMEYSPFELGIERSGVLDAAKELGVAVVAYSPLGRGMITGRFKSLDDFEADDLRRMFPRFSVENFPKNLKLVDTFERLGTKYGATPSQVALAWILAQDPSFVPIPGTKAVARLEENARGAEIVLSLEDVETIRKQVEEADVVHGARGPVIPDGDCLELGEWKK